MSKLRRLIGVASAALLLAVPASAGASSSTATHHALAKAKVAALDFRIFDDLGDTTNGERAAIRHYLKRDRIARRAGLPRLTARQILRRQYSRLSQ